ncbi:XRE family transcriptional regulator [Actinoplanes sp. ATCC 53533]|nr:XRE family transcriptional regulator [Actinoplanes sp. ATCC 53533]
MSLLRSAIGIVLRRLRHQQGRTLQDVAEAAGVSLPYLSEIERGRKEASSEILAAICGALGVALTELLDQVLAELLRTSPPTAPVRAPRMRVTCAGGCSAAERGLADLGAPGGRPVQRRGVLRRRGHTAGGDPVQGAQAGRCHAAEDRVVRAQRGVAVDQEELAAVGVRAGVGHGQHAAGVHLALAGRVGRRRRQAGGQFIAVAVAGAALAGPARVSALQH